MGITQIGAVTVGQAPREDVVPDMLAILGPDVRVLQRGALDGLSHDEVREHRPATADQVLVSRLRDGTEVEVDKGFVIPRVRQCIQSLEDGVEVILLLCTAPFRDFESKRPLLLPGLILEQLVTGLRPHRLGVLTPSPRQVEPQRDRWKAIVGDLAVEAASPYAGADGIRHAATRLAQSGVDLVVMDCIGYTRSMKAAVRDITNCPVMLAASTLARVAAELTERGTG